MELRLKELRKQAKINQTELAKKIGTTQRVVSSWETGETTLSVEDACKIATALGCTLDELAGRETNDIDPSLARNYRAMGTTERTALLATSDALAASAKHNGNASGGGLSMTPPRRGARRPMRPRERRASTVRTLFEQERK